MAKERCPICRAPSKGLCLWSAPCAATLPHTSTQANADPEHRSCQLACHLWQERALVGSHRHQCTTPSSFVSLLCSVSLFCLQTAWLSRDAQPGSACLDKGNCAKPAAHVASTGQAVLCMLHSQTLATQCGTAPRLTSMLHHRSALGRMHLRYHCSRQSCAQSHGLLLRLLQVDSSCLLDALPI